jgi:hypothetical protein
VFGIQVGGYPAWRLSRRIFCKYATHDGCLLLFDGSLAANEVSGVIREARAGEDDDAVEPHTALRFDPLR